MDFEFAEEQLAFVKEVEAFLDSNDDPEVFDVTRENMAQIVDTPTRRAFMASLAQHFSNTHHLQHLARTVVVVGANVAAFGVLWVLKFLVFNRLFAEIADKEVGVEIEAGAEAEA